MTNATTHTAARTNTIADRQRRYEATQATILHTLGALKARVLDHGGQAAGGQYHWGFLGDLDHIQAQLDALLTNEG